MKKKLLAALVLSLAMTAPQVKADPEGTPHDLYDTMQAGGSKVSLWTNQLINADLPKYTDKGLEINPYDETTQEPIGGYFGIESYNHHKGFELDYGASLIGFNIKEIYGFKTDGNGGAFNLTNDSSMTLDAAIDKDHPTDIYWNQAGGKGGAIFADYTWGGAVNLINTSVFHNKAHDKGGGIYIDYGALNIFANPGAEVEIIDNYQNCEYDSDGNLTGGTPNDIYATLGGTSSYGDRVRGRVKLHTMGKTFDPNDPGHTGAGSINVGHMVVDGATDLSLGHSSRSTEDGAIDIGYLTLNNGASLNVTYNAPGEHQKLAIINIAELTMTNNAVLNTVNNYIDYDGDNFAIGTITLDNTDNKFFVDADLRGSTPVIDQIGGVVEGGKLKLAVNIIGADTTSGSLRLFSNCSTTIAGSETQYGGSKYVFTQDPTDKGIIHYQATKLSLSLQDALKDITVDSYDMPDLYVANSDLGHLYHYDTETGEFVPRTFTVNGRNGVLIPDGVAERAGISIPQQLYPPEDDNLTPHLIVKDLDAYSGFTRRASDISAATGGAIWAEDSLLEVDNVTFTNNTATGTATSDMATFGMGGAIYVATRDGNYSGQDNFVSKINNSSFIDNKAVTYGPLGSAALVDGGGAVYSKGNLDVTDSLFANNSAISNMREYTAEGGALYVTHNSSDGGVNRDVNISGSMFMGNVAGDVLNDGELVNTAAYGGAIFASRVDMNIDDSSFINNTARAAQITNEYTTVKGEAQGGAIHIDKVATAGPYAYNINNSTFAMNTAEAVKSVDNGDGTYTLTTDGVNQSQAFGGAIAIMRPIETTPKIDVNIDGSDFYVNKAGSGGAIYNRGGLVNIKDSSFRSNVANHYLVDDNPRWNEDMTGGAIYNGHTMTIDGSEFSNNYAKQITYDGDDPIVSTVKNDIRNDRELYFVGKASYLDGGIAGSGYTYFDLDEDQTMNIGADTSIVQTVIGVNSGAVNIVNGDTVTARSELFVGEDGLLNIESGAITINSKYNREIENSGVLLNNGTLDVSEAQYQGSVTNNADALLMNGGTIVAKTITNDGSFSNGVNPANPEELVPTASVTGDFTNNYGLYNAGLMEGTLDNAGIFINDGMVTSAITNEAEGIIANSGEILNGFTNNGSFANMQEGIIDTIGAVSETITNSGDMINAGDILATTFSNSGTFLNGVNPSNIEEVIPEASVIATTINNSALMVNSGVLAGDKIKNNAGDLINNGTILGNFTNYSPNGLVENSGTIIGDVENYYSADSFINNGDIVGDVTNNGDGFVNSGTITGDVENNGGLTEVGFENYGTIDGNLDNSGNMLSNGKITGDVDNSGTLASKLDDIGGTINMSWSTAELELLDNGITFNESNKSKIQGNTGVLSLYGDIISDAVLDYTGKIKLNSGATVTKGTNGDVFQSASKIILNGGSTATLNTLNGVADALTYADMVIDTGVDSTLRLEMDWNDSLTAGGSLVAGDVEIAKLDLRDVAEGDKVTIITDTLGSKVVIRDIDLMTTKGNANSVTYTYHNGTVTTPGYGELTAVRIPNLVTVLDASDTAADENAYYNYAMSEDEPGSTADNIIGNLKVSGQGNSIVTTGLTIGDGTKEGNVILNDTNLKDITTMADGTGAVTLYDNSTLTIAANEHDVTLSGTSGANKNAIYMDTTTVGATVALEANNGHTLTIDDDIRSNNINNQVYFNNGTINVNGVIDPLTAVNTGADVTRGGVDENVTWQLFGGNLRYLSDSYLNNPSALNSIEFKGGNLDLINGAATTINLATLQLDATSNLYVDADLAAKSMDRFSAGTTNVNGGTLNVAGINLLSDAKEASTKINFIQDTGLGANDVAYTGSSALSRIFKYNVEYDNTTGDFNFSRLGGGNNYNDYNPSVFASPVAAQLGGYLVQLNSYDEAFRNMDMYMLMPRKEREAMKLRNKIASLQNAQYDDTRSMYDYNAGWFRPYATFETVPLHNGPNVRNVMYGSYFGGESSLKDLGHGWDGMWGAYVGYNGSYQSYNNLSIYQNGGTLGLTGMAYKDNFFVGGTINVGASGVEAGTMYGHEDFAMLMSGVALKTGYNWELANGKFIIQPSLLTSYSFINTFDYTNAAGVRMDSDPLHAIQVEPGIKFIGNLKHGWQPYAGVSFVYNIMDRTHFRANDVALPNLSINPFVKYGVGLRKTWGEKFTGFLQTYFTSGGRNGIGIQAGFRWAIGKDSTNEISGNTPELKKTQIKLSSAK